MEGDVTSSLMLIYNSLSFFLCHRRQRHGDESERTTLHPLQ